MAEYKEWFSSQNIKIFILVHNQELFNAIDSDNSGFINIKEMIEYLDSVCDDEVDEKDVRDIFSKLDVTGDRTIDLWEFQVERWERGPPTPSLTFLIILSDCDGADEERWVEEGQEKTSEKRQHLC